MSETTEHVHGCLNCKFDMVPAFDKKDLNYHTAKKCETTFEVLLDGKPFEPYSNGAFEGEKGWVLAGSVTRSADEIHPCPNCTTYKQYRDRSGVPHRIIDHFAVCLTAHLGAVKVEHRADCSVDLPFLIENLWEEGEVKRHTRSCECDDCTEYERLCRVRDDRATRQQVKQDLEQVL